MASESGSNAPAQAVYEYYTDSLSLAVVELANDNNNINISIKAHNTHPEVNSKLYLLRSSARPQ